MYPKTCLRGYLGEAGGEGGGGIEGGKVRISCLGKDPLAHVDDGSLYKDLRDPRRMTFFFLLYPSSGLITRQILYSTLLFELLTIYFFYIQDLLRNIIHHEQLRQQS